MKLKMFSIILIISIITFTETPKAFIYSNAVLKSNTYKEGIYDITNLQQVKATAMLVTPDSITSLLITDPNGNQIFYKKFDTVNEVVNLGIISDGDLIAVIGKGEITITINQ